MARFSERRILRLHSQLQGTIVHKVVAAGVIVRMADQDAVANAAVAAVAEEI